MKATALGCYGNTHPVSPHIDQLAAEAAYQFEQCHTVHPKCTPSRCSLLTGTYPHELGHRTLDIHTAPHEPNHIRTLKEQHGYQTALIGKNHVVDAETMPLTFDYRIDGPGKQQLEPIQTPMPRGSYWVGKDPNKYEDFKDTTQTDCALEWIDQLRDPEKPFFLWLNWGLPHPPYSAPSNFYGVTDRSKIKLPTFDDPTDKPGYHKALHEAYGLDRMTDEDWIEVIGTYYDMVAFIDHETKRINDYLHEKGMAEDTIVVFWSDHGDFAGEHQLPEKWDTSFYDCITRVPLMMWGGGIQKGSSDALVESIDIFPTLFEFMGYAPIRGIAGRSALPVMNGDSDTHRDFVFCQGGQEPEMLKLVVAPDAKPRPCTAYQQKQSALYLNTSINIRAKMIRDHDWKYIYHQSGFEELYDLKQDPDEIINLAHSEPNHKQLPHRRMQLMNKLVDAETRWPDQAYLES
ncbi:Choline-sulfatase (EC [Lentimonas sp. CC19]|nr:Choline-sulfatase (EC [Lentimonas sp. CC4]CAA6686303.1 Choline-sulfatase (EC [Lentimonas sp. CC6]CAA6695215.1 Choline-sulfatase (EC [Lentimonas sp. CC19]CAA6697312.1 Choline-sulfatase (EC [Lentimonas sp. CC10]CAA7070415.1 Choline-sulfatase (EC [Lentimonas sp. CC11]CAA7170928.1 Choline-sulfatase (EC [Lentimonas sp. CC21]CAA7181129.1 Choline-sulfatase (EC [Lentimonas sp. CC8]